MVSSTEDLVSRYLTAIRRANTALELFGSTTREKDELLDIAIKLPEADPLNEAIRSDSRAMQLVALISEQAARARRRGDDRARSAGWDPPPAGDAARDDAIGMLWEALFAYLPTREESLGAVRSRIRPHVRMHLSAREAITIDEIVFRTTGFTVRTCLVQASGEYRSDAALHDQSHITDIHDDLAHSYLVHVGHGSVRKGRRVNLETVSLCVPAVDSAAEVLFLRANVTPEPFGRGSSVEIPLRPSGTSALLARLTRDHG